MLCFYTRAGNRKYTVPSGVDFSGIGSAEAKHRFTLMFQFSSWGEKAIN